MLAQNQANETKWCICGMPLDTKRVCTRKGSCHKRVIMDKRPRYAGRSRFYEQQGYAEK